MQPRRAARDIAVRDTDVAVELAARVAARGQLLWCAPMSARVPSQRRDRIEIRGLSVQCVIGVRADERDREQPVQVELALTLDLGEAGRSARIADTVDYATVADELAAMLRFRRYKLLENAAEELAAMVLGVHPRVQQVELALSKPQALEHGRGASVAITRSAEDFPRRSEAARFGEVEVLLETREAGLYLLHVAAGNRIPLHHHEIMREMEWLVAGELVQHGEPLSPFSPREWSLHQRHAYDNPSPRRATLFCCDMPPYIPADEIDEHPAVGTTP